MSGCLGPVAAALVDGELDHGAREKAHRHLAHCPHCRAEVDAQRRLKARLLGLDGPAPSDALTARLLGLHPSADAAEKGLASRLLASDAPADRLTPRLLRPRTSVDRPTAPDALPARLGTSAPARPVTARPAAGPAGRRRALRRRTAAGTAFAALGVAAALALGGPAQSPASTPVDPGTDAFITEFVTTTNDGTVDDRAGLTRAGLTGGGAGGAR